MTDTTGIEVLRERRDAAFARAREAEAEGYEAVVAISRATGDMPERIAFYEALARTYRDNFSDESMRAKDEAYARMEAAQSPQPAA